MLTSFVDSLIEPSINAEPWDDPEFERSFNDDLVRELRRRPSADHSDVEVALVLCQLLQSEFTAGGADGSHIMAGTTDSCEQPDIDIQG